MRQKTKASQADFMKVRDHMIEPLLQVYNTQLNDYLRDAIADDLAHFSIDELDVAMIEIRRVHKRMPSPAHMIEACQAARHLVNKDKPHCASTDILPGRQREDNIKNMVLAYLKQYELTKTWREAVAEGWSFELWRYLHAVAEVQAQFIVGGSQHWWYDAMVIFNYKSQLDAESINAFKLDQLRQARTGQIDVAIPTGHIQSWRRVVASNPHKAKPASTQFLSADLPQSLGDTLEGVF